MPHPRRILLCGLGSIGRRHLRLLHTLEPSIELAALRSGRGAPCAEETLLSTRLNDMEEALDWRPDAAIVASPAPFHRDQAVALATAGVSLLVEKPLGTGAEPAAAWLPLRTAVERGQPILVGYVLRHDRALPVLREWLSSGAIGTPVGAQSQCGSWLPDWRPAIDYRECVSSRSALGGGVLLELSHELDLLLSILGPLQLHGADLGRSDLLEVDVEDRALLSLRTSAGMPVSVWLDFCSRPPVRSLTIRGSDGEIHWNLLSGQLRCLTGAGVVREQWMRPEPDERYQRQLSHFLECCRGEAKPLVSLEDGLAVLALVRQARAASP